MGLEDLKALQPAVAHSMARMLDPAAFSDADFLALDQRFELSYEAYGALKARLAAAWRVCVCLCVCVSVVEWVWVCCLACVCLCMGVVEWVWVGVGSRGCGGLNERRLADRGQHRHPSHHPKQTVELVPNGSGIPVTRANVQEYVDRYVVRCI